MQNEPTATTDLERLARDHAPFLRRLAFALVGEGGRADDLVQETWLAAARSREGVLRSPRAWLSRTARNIAWNQNRARARRAETSLDAEPASGRDTADIAASLEAERILVASLGDLDEPCRTAVYLRFREELAPAEIAERTGVPVNTVRSRLRRGLAQLRQRLDAGLGGSDETHAALLPLALGAASDRAGAWTVLFPALVVVVAVTAVLGARARSAPRIAAPSAVELQAEAAADPSPGSLDLTSPRQAATGGDGAQRTAGAQGGFSLIVRVLDEDGAAVSGMPIQLNAREVTRRHFPPRIVYSDGSGSALFEGLEAGSYTAEGPGSERVKGARVDGMSSVEVTYALSRPVRVEGRVLDDEGAGVAGASILVRSGASRAARLPLGTADSGGRFVVRAGAQMSLIAVAPGHAPSVPVRVRLLDAAAATLRVRRAGGALAGRVVDEHGDPVVGVVVNVDTDSNPDPHARHHVKSAVRTDQDGRYAFLQGFDVGDTVGSEALATGYAPRLVEVTIADGLTRADIALSAGRRVTGTVLLEDARPASGATVRGRLDASYLQSPTWIPVMKLDDDGRFELVDAPDSYLAMWWISVALGVFAMALHLLIDASPVPAPPPGDAGIPVVPAGAAALAVVAGVGSAFATVAHDPDDAATLGYCTLLPDFGEVVDVDDA